MAYKSKENTKQQVKRVLFAYIAIMDHIILPDLTVSDFINRI